MKSDKIKEFAANVHFLCTIFIQKRRENSNRIKLWIWWFLRSLLKLFSLYNTLWLCSKAPKILFCQLYCTEGSRLMRISLLSSKSSQNYRWKKPFDTISQWADAEAISIQCTYVLNLFAKYFSSFQVCILKSKAVACPRTGRYKCPVPKCNVDGRSRVGVAKHFRRDHKGGLISESFSLWLKSPKNAPNHYPKHHFFNLNSLIKEQTI